ncbi:hypothetical protein H310_15040 [Aphanomyces invadans]|uniref:Integrase zinc-binding domain-containing protein n=1 Tax=Aphanomyces invadans TaxID=157072 RepID=A0A024T7W6_9STRA|nr:hypothetical protein H310_15040 [Aphanomyces invadans]ETV90125.1 hypothetical protein H310_15040 [Aphanomyces invadans]|eukprot:XP_008881240.1 hypothetical protein H310_15040 [Aphanomyces invadans]
MDEKLKQSFIQAYAKTKEFEDATTFLRVPKDDFRKGDITWQSHDTSTTASPDIRRTQLHVAQMYHWNRMDEDVKLYVATLRNLCTL